MNLIENHKTSATIEHKLATAQKTNWKTQIIRRRNCEVNNCRGAAIDSPKRGPAVGGWNKWNWTATSTRCKIYRKLEWNNENLMENKQQNEQANNCEQKLSNERTHNRRHQQIRALMCRKQTESSSYGTENGSVAETLTTKRTTHRATATGTAWRTLTQHSHNAIDGRTRQQRLRATAEGIWKQMLDEFDEFDCEGSRWVATCRELLLMTEQTNGRAGEQTVK